LCGQAETVKPRHLAAQCHPEPIWSLASLAPERAGPKELPNLMRDCQRIGNKLHCMRDFA